MVVGLICYRLELLGLCPFVSGGNVIIARRGWGSFVKVEPGFGVACSAGIAVRTVGGRGALHLLGTSLVSCQ